jgi:hypothetical protein
MKLTKQRLSYIAAYERIYVCICMYVFMRIDLPPFLLHDVLCDPTDLNWR